jgi:uncharacterized protein (TIGR00290 family)
MITSSEHSSPDLPIPTILCWSSGKDSAWCLWRLMNDPRYNVVGLMTTVAEDAVPMHGVPIDLLRAQAAAAGLPLETVALRAGAPNEEYEQSMQAFLSRAYRQGVRAIAFGDLFLRDIREYRESRLLGSGIQPIFPLWDLPTRELAAAMIDGGLRAHVVSVDTSQLDARFVGREFDGRFIADLPASVDPCGENGEFHTFAYSGPMFRHDVAMIAESEDGSPADSRSAAGQADAEPARFVRARVRAASES